MGFKGFENALNEIYLYCHNSNGSFGNCLNRFRPVPFLSNKKIDGSLVHYVNSTVPVIPITEPGYYARIRLEVESFLECSDVYSNLDLVRL